ncbi:MAG: hypothetical protein JWN40_4936 [Phycisphaerales bacterium]|nr:hypothetical protein [Phycisphaerales bacterium]
MIQSLKPYVPVNARVGEVANYDGLLLRLGARDRAAVEKHIAVCETEPTREHATLWKRVACLLCNLAPKALQTAGQRAVQFFAADGKYRRQVFAMEDLRDGVLAVYMIDILQAAHQAGLMRAPIGKTNEAVIYPTGVDGPGVTLTIEALTSSNTAAAPDYFRHMVGWNRTVLKVTLPTTATTAQVEALEALCAIAGRAGAGPETPVV